MEICIRYGGTLHCHYIPLVEFPVRWYIPGPGPVNYPAFLSDAMIWNTIHALVRNVSDDKVRQAVSHGLNEGLKAMQQHAGADVEIKVTQHQA